MFSLTNANNAVQIKQFSDYEIPDDWRFVPIEAGTKSPIGYEWQTRLYSWKDVPKPGETIKAPFQNRETGEIYYKPVQVGAVGLYYEASGLVGLDFDGESADSQLVQWGITLPPTITISSGRPGRRLEIYKLPKAYQGRVKSKSFVTKPKVIDEFGREKDEQLEIFVNKQSLVYGMHPDTKKPYRVLNWVDPDKIPELPLELIYKILVSEQESKPTTAQNDTELARELLEYIPLGDFCWEQYRDFLFACHSAGLTENEVLEASRKSPKHTDKGFYQIWRYIKGKPGITIATLIYWAKQNGWKPKPNPGKASLEGEPNQKQKLTVANLLIDIALQEAKLWQSDSGETWADITVNGVFQWHPVRSRAFKNWLSRRLFERHEKPANNEAMQSCLNLLEAYAYGTPKRPVFLRTAQHDGHIYIDLSDDRWRVVQVSPDGWQVIESTDCPVRFARHDGQQPLPVPVPGGDINKLWELIPVVKASDQCLLLAWLTFALVPWGAKPILTLHGAKGAGKSWTAQTISYLVDPVKAPLLKAVGDSRQMAVAASKRWILAFDNLTSLTTDEQDCLCCAATGAGFSHRKLHTDLDEVFYEYTRPQILTAVDCVPTRSDLLDRCLLIAVDRITEDRRVPLEILESLREQYRPALLGALLDRVALGLKYKDTIKAPLPRMADFARFAMAVEYGQGQNGLQSGSFASAYQENIAGAVEKAIESNPVAAAILELMSTCTRWEGSAGALVGKLQDLSDDPRIKKLTARGLGRWLSSKANQTDLQAAGLEVDSYRSPGGKERGWLLTWADKPQKITSQMSQMSQARLGAGFGCDIIQNRQTDNVTSPPDNVTSPDNVTKTSQLEPRQGADCDVCDVCDIIFDGLSGNTSDSQDKSLSVPKSKDPDCQQKPDRPDRPDKPQILMSPTSPSRVGAGFSGDTVEQEPLQAAGGTGPNAVYWRKQRYQVQGDFKRAGREFYLLKGRRSAPKSECIPAGDLDIFATWNGEIPDWNPTSSPKPWQELRRVCFDIETTGLNPETDRVIAIAGGGPGIGAFVAADADEAKILRQFMATLRAVNPDILIGYNCYKFDLPFVIKRCEKHGIRHPFTISDKPKRLTKAVVAGKPLEVCPIYYNAKERQVSVIDLYPLVVAHDNITAQLESHTLKQAALGFGLRKSPRLELTASEIKRLWENYIKEGITEPLETILLYLNFDVEDTHLLAEFLLPQYYYQKILLPDLSLQQLTLAGTATKWNIVLKNHYRWEPEPDQQVPIEGGLMVVNPGLYRNCSKIDVSSLYPSIMLNYGVWTKKDKDRYGLGILKYLTRQRLELKRRAKSGDTEAGLMSGSIKIFINSAYGFLGTPGIPFNDYQEFAKVPAYGREILKFMLHYLETNAVIVEADTDGIIFSHPQPEALRDRLQSELPEGINIELEWTNTHVYCAKKKSYILFHPDGIIKANGIYKKRDKTKLEKIYPVEYLKRFLDGGLSEAEAYHMELEKSLSSGNHPISELTITRSIRANEKALLKLGKPGDTITFYQGDGGATTSGNYSARHYLEKISEIRTEILKVLAIPTENYHAKPD